MKDQAPHQKIRRDRYPGGLCVSWVGGVQLCPVRDLPETLEHEDSNADRVWVFGYAPERGLPLCVEPCRPGARATLEGHLRGSKEVAVRFGWMTSADLARLPDFEGW